MKKDINLLMGVVCALVSCTIAYADGPVKEGNAIVGHVIEKGSEAGLPYATVLLVETGEGTVTDAGGYFRFKKLPAGEYTLKVQIIRSVLPLQYCSTFLKVLEYFLCSTVVLSWKYWTL